jgi:hypothetical protein
VREVRPDAAVAFLCTPTDCHVITPEAAAAAKAARSSSALGMFGLEWALRTLSGGRMLAPNTLRPIEEADTGRKLYIVDGLIVPQGPNYALAKRLQHWRAQVRGWVAYL